MFQLSGTLYLVVGYLTFNLFWCFIIPLYSQRLTLSVSGYSTTRYIKFRVSGLGFRV